MKPASTLTPQLRAAAIALGDLLPELVFVGGAVISTLITDPGSYAERPTDDTDAITRSRGLSDRYALEERLRKRGFKQNPIGQSPICRWFKDDVVIDVMPDDPAILGFSNRWYRDAFASATEHDIDGVRARIITAVYFIASKLEAFDGRGQGDYQASHDLEDLFSVIDGRPELAEEIETAPDDVRAYIHDRVGALLDDPDFVDAIPGHLGYTGAQQARAPIVIERLERIAGRR